MRFSPVKNAFFTIAISLLAHASHADCGLKQTMKDMRSNVRYLNQNYRDPAKKQDVLRTSQALATMLDASNACPPTSAQGQMERYGDYFVRLKKTNNNFFQAINKEPSDLALAAQALAEFDQMKENGHKEFKN